MPKLVAKSPAAVLLPLSIGEMTLAEVLPEAITSVAPFKDQEAAVGKALGVDWPVPGQVTGSPEMRVVWSALGEAFVFGAPVAPKGAAVVDQTDGWAVFALEGPAVEPILARLTPLDLRLSVFGPNRSARSLLGHMSCLFVRVSDTRIELLVFRSMAATAVRELSRAMVSVSAQRGDITDVIPT